MGSLQMKRQKPAAGYRLSLLPPRNDRLKPFVGRGCCRWAERGGATAQMKARRGSEFLRRGVKKIKPVSTVNMEIDKPRRQIKIPGIKTLFRGNRITLPDSGDGTRIQAHPSFPQLLILKNHAGIMNISHEDSTSAEQRCSQGPVRMSACSSLPPRSCQSPNKIRMSQSPVSVC